MNLAPPWPGVLLISQRSMCSVVRALLDSVLSVIQADNRSLVLGFYENWDVSLRIWNSHMSYENDVSLSPDEEAKNTQWLNPNNLALNSKHAFLFHLQERPSVPLLGMRKQGEKKLSFPFLILITTIQLMDRSSQKSVGVPVTFSQRKSLCSQFLVLSPRSSF